ncbi:MAG: phage tail protein [Kineosporiaceae bacterium]
MRRPGWLVDQLPVGMVSEDFFARFVAMFEAEADTLMAHGDSLEHLADATVTPPEMLPWLAQWIGLPGLDPTRPEQLQRRLLRTGARTLAWRGTRRGLQHLLELLSGGPAEVSDGGGVVAEGRAPQDAAWVVMRVASTGGMQESDFVTLIADEVPAHVRVELWVADRQVWPAGPVDGPAG